MPDPFNEELGRRIRAAREGKMTQAALGTLVGLSRTAITNIECGRQRLLVEQLSDIAKAVGVAAGDLIPPAPRSVGTSPAEGTILSMPTVSRWLNSVKKNAQRSRA